MSDVCKSYPASSTPVTFIPEESQRTALGVCGFFGGGIPRTSFDLKICHVHKVDSGTGLCTYLRGRCESRVAATGTEARGEAFGVKAEVGEKLSVADCRKRQEAPLPIGPRKLNCGKLPLDLQHMGK